MSKFNLIFSLVIICFWSISCEKKCRVNGIEIGYLLISNAEESGVDYCELVEKSFHKENHSLKKLSLLNFEDSVIYDHGEILVDLISHIGEQKFIDACQGINEGERHIIRILHSCRFRVWEFKI